MDTTQTRPFSLAQIANALGCNTVSAKRRLTFLGYVEDCGRCGGTGRYSYNQMDGDRCFGCAGARKVLARITPATLVEIQRKIADGALVEYFRRSDAIKAAKKAIAPIVVEIDREWRRGAIHTDHEAGWKAGHRTGHETISALCSNAAKWINGLRTRAWEAERRAANGRDVLGCLDELTDVLDAMRAANACYLAMR